MTVSISVEGASLGFFASNLNLAATRARSFRVPLEQSVDQVIRPSFRTNFRVEGRPSWIDLSPETKASRISKGIPPGPILDRRRGAIGLKYAAQQKNIWEINGQSGTAVIRSLPERVWYGRLHDFGEGGMPQRRFFSITNDDVDKIEQIFESWFLLNLRRTGVVVG